MFILQGVTPAFDCDNSTIYEIDYYHNLRGSIVDGKFERIGKLRILLSHARRALKLTDNEYRCICGRLLPSDRAAVVPP